VTGGANVSPREVTGSAKIKSSDLRRLAAGALDEFGLDQ
jgi:hypothetical protein